MTKDKPIILFRADGHAKMGLGHLVRSCALADMLADDYRCYLIYRYGNPSIWSSNPGILKAIALVGNDEQEIEELTSIAKKLNKKTGTEKVNIVLDGYHFDFAYQAALKMEGFNLVFIDDIQHCEFLADLVINHAPAVKMENYQLSRYSKTAFGLRFALLREPFMAPSMRRSVDNESAPVFLCLGGSDPDNLTIKVLKVLKKIGVLRAVSLVIGAAYEYKNLLDQYLIETSQEVSVHQNVSSDIMAELMSGSAFGITSPSTVALEYLATGKQLYLCQTADNQEDLQAALLDQQLAYPLEKLLAKQTYPLNRKSLQLYDGNQSIRFRKLFKAINLKFREVRYDDCRLLYNWTIDADVRAQSFNKDDISWQSHKSWFGEQLASQANHFFICLNGKKPIGLVRFFVDGSNATLGYSIDSNTRGKGYGLGMVHFGTELLLRRVTTVNRISAFVKKGNMASRITLVRLGYTGGETNEYPDALKFTLDV